MAENVVAFGTANAAGAPGIRVRLPLPSRGGRAVGVPVDRVLYGHGGGSRAVGPIRDEYGQGRSAKDGVVAPRGDASIGEAHNGQERADIQRLPVYEGVEGYTRLRDALGDIGVYDRPAEHTVSAGTQDSRIRMA